MTASASSSRRRSRAWSAALALSGGELRRHAFDRALGVEDFGRGDAGEVELHRQRLGEQARIAGRDAGAAAFAHLDVDDAERRKRAQRVARRHAAHVVARGELFLGAEEVAGLEPLLEQIIAHLRHDLRGQRGGAAGEEVPLLDQARG